MTDSQLPASPVDDAMKILERVTKLSEDQYSKANAFLNVVLIGGYAAFFTIWSFTKAFISPSASLWAALMLTISAGLFLTFEFVNMLYITASIHKFSSRLSGNTPHEILGKFAGLDAEQRCLNRRFQTFWYFVVPLTFSTAMVGVLILGTQFVLQLLRTT